MKISALALFVVAALPVDAQVSPAARANSVLAELGQYFNTGVLATPRVSDRYERDRYERDRYDRECREDWRNVSQRRLQLEQRLRQQHDNWHRTHDSRRDANWQRQHEALHERLQRERQVFERNEDRVRQRAQDQARRQRTDEVWRRSQADDRDCNDDDDDDRYDRRDRDDDWHDRDRSEESKRRDKLNKELAKLDRKREHILEKERRRTDR